MKQLIRPATLSDIPRLYELVLEMHEASKYGALDMDIHEATAKALLRDGVMRNGRTNNGGTLLNVVEFRGKVEGFMLGVLQRVYCIGNRLEAQDFFLFCTPKAPLTGFSQLLAAYVKWADDNPKVLETKLSWTNAVGVNGNKLGKLYQRHGFEQCGEIWSRMGK